MAQKDESHDWFGDLAESLIRYYFSKIGFYAYGSSKWGPDIVIQNKNNGKMLTIEVKSSDRGNYLKGALKKKLKKMQPKVRPDIYAEVRMPKKDSNNKTQLSELSVKLYKIQRKNFLATEFSLNDSTTTKLSRWVKDNF